MSHSERIENALKEAKRKLNLNGLAIVCLRAIISKHIPEQNELRKIVEELSNWPNFVSFESGVVIIKCRMCEEWWVKGESPKHLDDCLILRARSLATPSEPLGVTKEEGK